MAHQAQFDFIAYIKECYPSFFNGGRILEVGSLNINGTVRGFFDSPEEYIGIDVGEGPGVDIVCPGDQYDSEELFDCVISCECMEHNPQWPETFDNMIRLCRPKGLVIMTCATTGRAEHGTVSSTPQDSPLTTALGWNYYRNLTARDFMLYTALPNSFYTHAFQVNEQAHDLYFCGIKL